jgi:hypothetical protein
MEFVLREPAVPLGSFWVRDRAAHTHRAGQSKTDTRARSAAKRAPHSLLKPDINDVLWWPASSRDQILTTLDLDNGARRRPRVILLVALVRPGGAPLGIPFVAINSAGRAPEPCRLNHLTRRIISRLSY